MSGFSADEMMDEDEKYASSNHDDADSNSNEELLLRPQVKNHSFIWFLIYFPFLQSSIIYLTTKDIFPRIEKKLKAVQELLSCSLDEALIILHHFKWSLEKIETLYLDNPEKYQIDSGLKLSPKHPNAVAAPATICQICQDPNTKGILTGALECNHKLCPKCWGEYINFLVFFFIVFSKNSINFGVDF